MNIQYKIVEVWPNDHAIVVRYYTDNMTEEELASQVIDGKVIRCRTDVSITLPIPEPSEEELNKLIMLNCPLSFFETQEKIKDPNIDTSMSLSSSLLNKEKVTTEAEIIELLKPPMPSENAPLTDAEIEELIQKL